MSDARGAFIGDGLGLGPHWYYDLAELRRDFGEWIDGYTAPKLGARYHVGMKAGELSQTGNVMLLLLRSVTERGTYDQADVTRRLDEELLPNLSGDAFDGPGGYTNHSFHQVWQARVREGKPCRQPRFSPKRKSPRRTPCTPPRLSCCCSPSERTRVTSIR